MAAILDTIEKTGEMDTLDNEQIQAPCVTISEDDKVLQQLKNISDWTNGVDTSLDHILYDGEKKEKAHIVLLETNEWKEIEAAEKTQKQINRISQLKDFDLSYYQDASEKFAGGVTQRRDLFVFPIILPCKENSEKKEKVAKIPDAGTISEHFAVQKERLLPAEHGRRLVFRYMSSPLEYDAEKNSVKCKAQVCPLDDRDQLAETNKRLKSYEKKRVIWAAVMMRSHQVGSISKDDKEKLEKKLSEKFKDKEDNDIKGLSTFGENVAFLTSRFRKDWDFQTSKGFTEWSKIPNEEDWEKVIAALESVDDWDQLIVKKNLSADSGKQFSVRLFKTSEWIGPGNIACLNLTRSDLDNVRRPPAIPESLFESYRWDRPEKFYKDNELRNNFYIFPIAVDRAGQLLDTEFWVNERRSTEEQKIDVQKFLMKYCLDESEVAKLPTFTLELPSFTLELPSFTLVRSTIPVLPTSILGSYGFKPTESKEYYITGRFFDYGVKADGVDGPFACKMLRYTTWRDTIYKEFGKSVPGETQKLGLMNHNGVDLHAVGGDKIRAVAAGTICAAGPNFSVPALVRGNSKDYGPYPGFSIIISHGNGLYTHYAHMSKSQTIRIGGKTYNPQYPRGNPDNQRTPAMIGLKVEKGNVIGHSGRNKEYKTDTDGEEVTIPLDHTLDEHLHFEIIYIEDDGGDEKSSFPVNKNFYYLNPEHYLNPPDGKVRNYEYEKPRATKKT